MTPYASRANTFPVPPLVTNGASAAPATPMHQSGSSCSCSANSASAHEIAAAPTNATGSGTRWNAGPDASAQTQPPSADAGRDEQPDDDACSRAECQIAVPDRPAQEGADRARRGERRDDEHSITAEEAFEVHLFAIAAFGALGAFGVARRIAPGARPRSRVASDTELRPQRRDLGGERVDRTLELGEAGLGRVSRVGGRGP